MRIGGMNKNGMTKMRSPLENDSRSRLRSTGGEKSAEILENEKDNKEPIALTISEEGKQKAKGEINESKAKDNYFELLSQLEEVRQQSEATGEAMGVKIKCLVISSRIMAGDEVPLGDYRYLAKNDPELYGRAVIMRRQNEDPKKHKKVSEDEESDSEGGAGGTPSTENLPLGGMEMDAAGTEVVPSAGAEIQIEAATLPS